MKWPHPDFCRCTECVSVGIETRREERERAKREVQRILALRGRRVPLPGQSPQ